MAKPYSHSYGGIAIDQEVTRDAFCDEFGFKPFELHGLPRDEKIATSHRSNGEILGYITKDERFVVTLIAHTVR